MNRIAVLNKIPPALSYKSYEMTEYAAAAQRFPNKGKLNTKTHHNKSQLFQFQILDKPRQRRDSALKQDSAAGEHINMLTCWSCQ